MKYPVAFITSHGRFDTWCGAQESHFQIVKHLRGSILSITAGPKGISRTLSDAGFPVEMISYPVEKVYGFRQASAFKKIHVVLVSLCYCLRVFFILKKYRVRVVYTVIGPVIFLAPFAVKLAGARLITGIRGTPLRVTRWRRVFRLSDRVAALSKETKDILLFGLSGASIPNLESKIKVIFNGVDLSKAGGANEKDSIEIRRRLGVERGGLLMLYAAAFRAWKGQLRFIQDVLPQVFAKGVTTRKPHVVFIGSAAQKEEEDYERRCREAAFHSGLGSHVHFCGFQSDVWPWYRAADMVVLASENLEGMARVIIEAMASGKPVVCYDVCSARELLGASGGGIIVPQDDARGMAGAIASLGKSLELREEMGKRGREFAARHLDIRAVSKAYEKMFRELLG